MASFPIEIDKLTKRFSAIIAVSELSFNVAPGEVVGFLGPNGAGKTTTMRLLLGFLRPTLGRCSVLGLAPRDNIAVRGRIGYLPGDLRVDPEMTGSQLFRWYGRLRRRDDRVRVAELTERLDLDPDRPFGSLSKGNRQKVGIVQALAHRPEVLVLDEPTTGLDPLVQRELLTLVREAADDGAAVLFSSHVLPEVERIADRVAIIRSGHLVSITTTAELLDRTRQRIELRFAASVPEILFDSVDGVHEVQIDGATAVLTIDGPVGPALTAALRGPQIVRVKNDSDDLEDLFLSLYRGQEN